MASPPFPRCVLRPTRVFVLLHSSMPGCLRVIHFKLGEPYAHPGFKKNARGKYKTRADREFCKGRGCKQKYHYRKKAGWRGYY